MDKTKTALITLLVILLFGIPVLLGSAQKRILVIHSYGEESAWVGQVKIGIQDYLNRESGFAGTVRIDHYYLDMETLNRQRCETYLAEMRNAAQVINDKKPDVIILSDDIAQRLVGTRLVEIDPEIQEQIWEDNARWLAREGGCDGDSDKSKSIEDEIEKPLSLEPQPQVVFLGVDNDVDDYGYYDARNVAGIFEHVYNPDNPALKEIFQDLYRAIPEDKNKPQLVIMIGDQSSLSSEDFENIKNDPLWDYFDVGAGEKLDWGVDALAEKSFEDWKDAVTYANKNHAMIFVAGYEDIIRNMRQEQEDEDEDEHTTEIEIEKQLVQCTEKIAGYPVVGRSKAFIDAGGMLAIMPSGKEQGEKAMELARQLLDGDKPKEFKEPEWFILGMNKHLVDKDNLNLPVYYEAFSRESGTFFDIIPPEEIPCN